MATNTLQYGDYTVDPTWKYTTAYGTSTGSRAFTVYNPADPTQNFTTSNTNQILEYLGSKNMVGIDQAVNLGLYSPNAGATGSLAYTPTSLLYGGGKTWEQLQEQQRLASLATKVSSGQVSVAEGTAQANDPALNLTIPKLPVETTTTKTLPGSGITAADRYRMRQPGNLTTSLQVQGGVQQLQSATVLPTVTASPTQVLNVAQKQAYDAIKPIPTTDPNTLKEKASQTITSGVSDIQTQLQDIVSAQDKLVKDVTAFVVQSELEKDLNRKINDLDTSYEKGVNKVRSDAEGIFALHQGEEAFLERQYLAQRNNLVRQLTSETASRQQKLDAAKFLYDANRNKLSDTILLYNTTKPENIENVTDPVTGEMTVVMQNPLTGEITKRNIGQVQTPEKWTNNIKLAQDNGVNQPFFTVDGRTIINTNTGREYSTPDQFFADGGTQDFAGVQRLNLSQQEASNTIQTVGGRIVKFGFNKNGEVVSKIDLGAASSNKSLQEIRLPDGSSQSVIFDPDSGKFTPVATAADTKFEDGTIGGQCGTFAHKLVDFPPVGDTIASKQATVDKNGIRADQWRQEGAQVGDVVIQNIGSAGHVSVITAVNSDGTFTVKESNYGLDGKIGSRTMSMNDGRIYGVIRGQLKVDALKSNDTESLLKATRGEDGFVNPDRFTELRAKNQNMSPDEFDKRYGYLLSPQQQKNLGIAGGSTAQDQKFLTSQYFRNLFSTEEILKQTGTSFGMFTRNKDQKTEQVVTDYLNDLMNKVNAYREAGYTDKEILSLMQS